MKKVLFYIFLIAVCAFLWDCNVAFAGESENAFRLPEYKKTVLANGLNVYLMEQHEVPLVYVNAVLPAGADKDGNKYGLASLTADGLLFGTKNYTKKQIEEALDFIGASYQTAASKEYAELAMSFVKSDQDTVFKIMKDILTQPVFSEEEFDKRKKRLLVDLERAKERPASVIANYYNRFLFGDHVYANPVDGTIGTVSEITVNDLKAFYKTNYTPSGSAIAVVGDFETGAMLKTLRSLLESWQPAASPAPVKKGDTPNRDKSRILLVNKDDATETRFLIGGFGIKRSNPDYVAVQVINTILGGRFTSWLNDELRINRGLTYGARSYFATFKDGGTFAMSSFTGTENTVEAIDVALEVLNRLHSRGVDEGTLLSAKNYIKGQYPPRYETAGSLASLLTSMFIYEFDESFINNFQKNVDEMTVAKGRDIVHKYFPEDNLQFVLIGKASEIKKDVQKYGLLTVKEIMDDGY